MDRLPEPIDQDEFKTLNILAYEVGDINKALVHAWRRPKLKNAYLAEARISIADAYLQLRLVAQMLGFNFKEIMEDGEERFLERLEDIDTWRKE